MAMAGSARLVLPEGVGFLDPTTAVFEAMLEGWARQVVRDWAAYLEARDADQTRP